MEFESIIEVKNLKKRFKNFTLDIPELKIPKGLATALIGENGAGKSTLLNSLAGIRLDYEGSIRYFNKYDDNDREDNPAVKEAIGYTGTDHYFLPHWTVDQVKEINSTLFEDFNGERFESICRDLAMFGANRYEGRKKVSSLSDGTKTKLMLAGVLARNTDILLLDEPASPLDPLMRDKLCELIQDYLNTKEGRSVFFSTHNISDMENVTDYAIIMEHGRVVEQGFVEDLKEKYILVKGEEKDATAAKGAMYTMSQNKYGFEGMCLAENLDKLAGLDVVTEAPTLFQISVAVMKKNTFVR